MSPFGSTNKSAEGDEFVFGNIVRSPRARGWLYDLGMAGGVALTGANAAYAYLITQGATEYPLWLGASMAVYVVVAPAFFGVSKANLPTK